MSRISLKKQGFCGKLITQTDSYSFGCDALKGVILNEGEIR